MYKQVLATGKFKNIGHRGSSYYIPSQSDLYNWSVEQLVTLDALITLLDSLGIGIHYYHLTTGYVNSKQLWIDYLATRTTDTLSQNDLLTICKSFIVKDQSCLPMPVRKHLKSLRPKSKSKQTTFSNREYMFNALDLELLRSTLSTVKFIPATTITTMLDQAINKSVTTALIERYLDLMVTKLKSVPKSLLFALDDYHTLPDKYNPVSAYELVDIGKQHNILIDYELAETYSTDTPFIPAFPIVTTDPRTLTRVENVIQILHISSEHPMLLNSLLTGLTPEQLTTFNTDFNN